MKDMIERAGLKVAPVLAEFIEARALPGTGIGSQSFWEGSANIFNTFAPENRKLLVAREEMQTKLDAWHRSTHALGIQAALNVPRQRKQGSRRHQWYQSTMTLR